MMNRQIAAIAAQAETLAHSLPTFEDALRAAQGRSNEQRTKVRAVQQQIQAVIDECVRSGKDGHEWREQQLDELDDQLTSSQAQYTHLDDVVIDAERLLCTTREKLRALERQAQEAIFEGRLLSARQTEQQRENT